MNRALWFFGEIVAGVLASGIIAAISAPFLTQAGRNPGPAAVWVTLAVTTVLCIMTGESVRKARQRR